MVSVDGSQILARKYLSPYRLKISFDLLLSVGLCLMVLNVTALPFLAWRMVNVPESPTDSIRYSPLGMRLLPTIKSKGISALIFTVNVAAKDVASEAPPKPTATIRLKISFFIFLLRIRRPDELAGRGWIDQMSFYAVELPLAVRREDRDCNLSVSGQRQLVQVVTAVEGAQRVLIGVHDDRRAQVGVVSL